MKIFCIPFFFVLFNPVLVFAQPPDKLSYQAVVRNSSNSLLTNQNVGMRISILQGSFSGTSVYSETHIVTTNLNGLASIEVGTGSVISGNFSYISWANGPYFIKTETDPAGGTNYSIVGTQQLLSVPYALFSGNGIMRVSASGDTLYLGNGNHLIVPGISSANNSGGAQTGITQHTCGADSVHNPNLTYGTMTDQDGNVYKTIVIGSQEWMAENLKASHYRNGDLIQLVNFPSAVTWSSLNSGATCFGGDSSTFICPNGKLYNWYAVADSRNICPAGWHVPTDLECITLTDFLGGELIAGGKMKSLGYQYWTSANTAADNSSGFSGLPSGGISPVGNYTNASFFWWSSTEYDSTDAWGRFLNVADAAVYHGQQNKTVGMSVRCLRD